MKRITGEVQRYNIHCNVVKNLINVFECWRKYVQNFAKSEEGSRYTYKRQNLLSGSSWSDTESKPWIPERGEPRREQMICSCLPREHLPAPGPGWGLSVQARPKLSIQAWPKQGQWREERKQKRCCDHQAEVIKWKAERLPNMSSFSLEVFAIACKWVDQKG